jgi:hypothetical protein
MLEGGAPMGRRTIDPESNFELTVVGYNRQQVDRHIKALEQRMDEAAAAFDAAITLQNQLNEARAEIIKLRELTRTMPGQAVGDHITAVLLAAEEQAAAIRAQAEQEAQAIRGDAAPAEPATPEPVMLRGTAVVKYDHPIAA